MDYLILFRCQNLEKQLSYSLSANAIDHWICQGRNKDVDISHKDMNVRGHIMAKPVSKEGEKG